MPSNRQPIVAAAYRRRIKQFERQNFFDRVDQKLLQKQLELDHKQPTPGHYSVSQSGQLGSKVVYLTPSGPLKAPRKVDRSKFPEKVFQFREKIVDAEIERLGEKRAWRRRQLSLPSEKIRRERLEQSIKRVIEKKLEWPTPVQEFLSHFPEAKPAASQVFVELAVRHGLDAKDIESLIHYSPFKRELASFLDNGLYLIESEVPDIRQKLKRSAVKVNVTLPEATLQGYVDLAQKKMFGKLLQQLGSYLHHPTLKWLKEEAKK